MKEDPELNENPACEAGGDSLYDNMAVESVYYDHSQFVEEDDEE